MALLEGRTAMVTGAARGQGRAYAVRLAAEGAAIVGIDLDFADPPSVEYPVGNPDDLAETVRLVEAVGGTMLAVVGDVRSQESLDAALAAGVERFGGVDIAVANAGIMSMGRIHELSEHQWGEMLDVNLSGAWRTVKAVAPGMISRCSGSIVMIGSINSVEPTPQLGHYTSAKHGLVGLMRTVALELAPHGVRCNLVSPGSVDTGMINWQGMYDRFAGRPGGTRLDMRRGGARYSALAPADVIDPDEVAKAVLYLASELSSSVTGVVLPVDRGHLLLAKQNTDSSTWADGLAQD